MLVVRPVARAAYRVQTLALGIACFIFLARGQPLHKRFATFDFQFV